MSQIFSLLGNRRQRVSTVRHVVIDIGGEPTFSTFDEIVNSFGADVTSYWKMQNSGTDEKGVQNAVITGTPDLNRPTIVDLDTVNEGAPSDGTVIGWPGTTGHYAQVAHNAVHKTSQGTVVLFSAHDSLAEKSTLLAADANATTGGIGVEVTVTGAIRSFLALAASYAVLTGPNGDVVLGQAYTHFFKWGSGGLSHSLWDDDGNLIRRLTNTTTSGLAGTSPIRFGAWHTDVSHHDGPEGRIIWMSRRISDNEEATLARARTPPVEPPPGGGTFIGPTILTSARINDQLTSVGAILIESQEPA